MFVCLTEVADTRRPRGAVRGCPAPPARSRGSQDLGSLPPGCRTLHQTANVQHKAKRKGKEKVIVPADRDARPAGGVEKKNGTTRRKRGRSKAWQSSTPPASTCRV